MGEPLFLDQDLRDLLHRAADVQAGLGSETLSPAELARLAQVPLEVRQAHLAAWASAAALRSRPPLPHSLAAALAGEVALSARLQAAPAAPPGPTLAGSLAADIALSARLQQARPALPRSQAAASAGEIALAAQLQPVQPPRLPGSSAALLAARISHSAGDRPQAAPVPAARRSAPHPVIHSAARRDSRSAPLALVSSLIAGLLLLAVSSTWNGLSAGAGVLRGLVGSLPPTFGLGLALLLGTSLLLARPASARSLPGRPLWGSAAFAAAALLTLPPLYGTLDRQGVSVGRDIVIEGQRTGPVVALGGNIHLRGDSVVNGQVFTLLGDIRQDPGAQVVGPVTALLGQGPGTAALPPDGSLSDLQLASATAIRPLLGWLGGTAWSALFWILTSTLTLALFVSGAAGQLAGRQSQAPLRTLALGVLALAALLLPAALLTFAGWLVPALGLCLLLALLLALGLGVSAFDVGRQLACRLHAKMPDTLGVLIALVLLSATMVWPSLTLAVILIGGAWGSGSLLLIGRGRRGLDTVQDCGSAGLTNP
ncbi:hypothetical protein Deipr_0094 [Deinococcus proteolyticus MRP]|uniref:Polymer-forming cytoskeletal protein n=1 Tax=Deinococcus proteolyticus (strain ATCC 35074 / DSM 20540 / JCM 6276 / NBRC 101906 / NCIMB 13154 / VKM Ac-1939 / CCM 2703 / MRP) TaxID=693977 RepID=F0RNN6_DEIPM|nr:MULTISPECIES: hypothetical protein [Deinococcus]ADY25269.1 hypothetical protein Deipr_0094 [Deinococcus proteolyticus MRP]MCY1703370.1 polymer-forming cytoskeletal protein [Deinococcus sp. SL84]